MDSQILMFDLVSHLSCGLILNFIFYHFDVTLTQIETIHSVKQPDFGPLISQTASFRKVINQAQKWFKLNRNWRFAFDVSSLFYQMIDSFFFTAESNQIDTHSTLCSNISILRVSTLTPFISNFTSFVWDRRWKRIIIQIEDKCERFLILYYYSIFYRDVIRNWKSFLDAASCLVFFYLCLVDAISWG